MLYWMLREVWSLPDRTGPKNLLQGNASAAGFHRLSRSSRARPDYPRRVPAVPRPPRRRGRRGDARPEPLRVGRRAGPPPFRHALQDAHPERRGRRRGPLPGLRPDLSLPLERRGEGRRAAAAAEGVPPRASPDAPRVCRSPRRPQDGDRGTAAQGDVPDRAAGDGRVALRDAPAGSAPGDPGPLIRPSALRRAPVGGRSPRARRHDGVLEVGPVSPELHGPRAIQAEDGRRGCGCRLGAAAKAGEALPRAPGSPPRRRRHRSVPKGRPGQRPAPAPVGRDGGPRGVAAPLAPSHAPLLRPARGPVLRPRRRGADEEARLFLLEGRPEGGGDPPELRGRAPDDPRAPAHCCEHPGSAEAAAAPPALRPLGRAPHGDVAFPADLPVGGPRGDGRPADARIGERATHLGGGARRGRGDRCREAGSALGSRRSPRRRRGGRSVVLGRSDSPRPRRRPNRHPALVEARRPRGRVGGPS